MSNRREIDPFRLIIFLCAIAGGLGLSFQFGDVLSRNVQALSAVAGLSATFAGFIIAVKTLLGDASALLPGNWRLAVAQSEEIKFRFNRLSIFFYIFSFCAFVPIILIITKDDHSIWRALLSKIFSVAFGAVAVMVIELPRSLRSIQQDRIDAIVRGRLGDGGTSRSSAP
jgi:hypothetical protein